MGALRDQTALNIREWGGRRKQDEKTATSERFGWPSLRLWRGSLSVVMVLALAITVFAKAGAALGPMERTEAMAG